MTASTAPPAGSANEPWTVGRVTAWATDDFRARGIESPRFEAELLLSEVIGLDRVRIIVERDRVLDATELGRYRQVIQRRRAGEPMAYILGRREFYGRTFRVDRRALIPRPDTETLVGVALERTAPLSLSARTLDLCTGSGCVAITIARERPTVRIDAVDLSAEAIALARENAMRLGAVGRVAWRTGDLYAALDTAVHYDLIVANPPYIAEPDVASLSIDIRDFEPRIALVGGSDGLAITRRIVSGAPALLVPGGVLAVEIGSDQAAAVVELFNAAALVEVRVDRDYGGHERVVSGVRASLS